MGGFDLLDGHADGIQEGSGTADEVILFGKGLNCLQVDAVVEHFVHVVKEDGGHHRLPREGLLLFEHGIETADGVFFQPCHGAAPVQDKNQFSKVLFHGVILLIVVNRG
jgi:hypothetical protein